MHDYSINERTYTIAERDIVTVSKTDGTWLGDRPMPNNREIDESKVNGLLSAIDGLSIVGVRPKPPGLSASLTQLDAAAGLAQGRHRDYSEQEYCSLIKSYSQSNRLK